MDTFYQSTHALNNTISFIIPKDTAELLNNKNFTAVLPGLPSSISSLQNSLCKSKIGLEHPLISPSQGGDGQWKCSISWRGRVLRHPARGSGRVGRDTPGRRAELGSILSISTLEEAVVISYSVSQHTGIWA